MAEVGYIKPEYWEDLVRYHDRLVKRWRQTRRPRGVSGVTPIKQLPRGLLR